MRGHTYILTGDLVMGGIVGVANRTASSNPCIDVPSRIKAIPSCRWGARNNAPRSASSNVQSPSERPR